MGLESNSGMEKRAHLAGALLKEDWIDP